MENKDILPIEYFDVNDHNEDINEVSNTSEYIVEPNNDENDILVPRRSSRTPKLVKILHPLCKVKSHEDIIIHKLMTQLSLSEGLNKFKKYGEISISK